MIVHLFEPGLSDYLRYFIKRAAKKMDSLYSTLQLSELRTSHSTDTRVWIVRLEDSTLAITIAEQSRHLCQWGSKFLAHKVAKSSYSGYFDLALFRLAENSFFQADLEKLPRRDSRR